MTAIVAATVDLAMAVLATLVVNATEAVVVMESLPQA